jgi:hypothetical protein
LHVVVRHIEVFHSFLVHVVVEIIIKVNQALIELIVHSIIEFVKLKVLITEVVMIKRIVFIECQVLNLMNLPQVLDVERIRHVHLAVAPKAINKVRIVVASTALIQIVLFILRVPDIVDVATLLIFFEVGFAVVVLVHLSELCREHFMIHRGHLFADQSNQPLHLFFRWLLRPPELVLPVVQLVAERWHSPQDLYALLVNRLFDHHR